MRTIFYTVLLLIIGSCSDSSENAQVSTDSISLSDIDTVSSHEIEASAIEIKAYDITEQLKSTLKVVTIDGEDHYVVESDLLMDGDELYRHTKQLLTEKDTSFPSADTRKLTLAKRLNGRSAVWPNGSILKYTILRRSFDSPENFQRIRAYMDEATKGWMRVCNIRFEYDSSQTGLPRDSGPVNGLSFVIRELNVNGDFIASAFFPGDPIYKRKLFIDPSFYGSSFQQAGVLRHELGHILGFRHEHVWSQEEACRGESIIAEGLGAQRVTVYDPYSVMHYKCGNSGTLDLKITGYDSIGARKVYPFNNETAVGFGQVEATGPPMMMVRL